MNTLVSQLWALARPVDGARRWSWCLSVAVPLLPILAIGLAEATGLRALLAMPLAVMYLLIPALDAWIGTDSRNPAEDVVPALERDPYYRSLTFVVVPLHFAVLAGGMAYVVLATHTVLEALLLTISLGFAGGLAINVGHELGHKHTGIEKRLAQLALAIAGYGHFRIEHNVGHHAAVATPEDHASARMGESVYRFVRREIPGGLRRGWRLEKARLARRGRRPWSPDNEILQSWAVTILFQGALVAWLGLAALPWLLLHNAWAWFLLTAVNYIEHYGLLRRRGADGRLEPCRPHHSWNSNHVVSNLLLFHLQRHSDHHAHADRRYQSLRHFPEAPQLPTGYMGMIMLAYLPSVYFRMMDPRLLAQVGGDLDRVNLYPGSEGELRRRYGSAASPK
ncbi:MAG: alkane 1-monooxygenase [Steroidobacteraceae bacterium]|jgi:alkane 1-monooxygenase|nr:alkane 1-monooxygenase [Steroidobacteraceae bacterium]